MPGESEFSYTNQARRSACFRALAAVMAAASPLVVQSAAKADPIEFYRNKTIEILVGFSAGGGYDAYARALARSIANHIPGRPQIIVRNFTGAGSLRLARYLQDAAPHDGLSFGTIDNGLMIASLTKDGVEFNASRLNWIGNIARDRQVCLTWQTSKAKTLDDLRNIEAVFGATGRDDIRYVSTDILRKVGGAKIKIVTGYPGTTDIRLAVEKGEIDGVCESWSSLKATKRDWIEEKRINILVQFGEQRHPELPDVPLIIDYAHSSTEIEALNLIFSPAEAGRPFGAPPDIPEDRLDALRRAFDATMKDPEFLALANQEKLDVDPTTGEQIEDFLKKAYGAPPAVVTLAHKFVE